MKQATDNETLINDVTRLMIKHNWSYFMLPSGYDIVQKKGKRYKKCICIVPLDKEGKTHTMYYKLFYTLEEIKQFLVSTYETPFKRAYITDENSPSVIVNVYLDYVDGYSYGHLEEDGTKVYWGQDSYVRPAK